MGTNSVYSKVSRGTPRCGLLSDVTFTSVSTKQTTATDRDTVLFGDEPGFTATRDTPQYHVPRTGVGLLCELLSYIAMAPALPTVIVVLCLPAVFSIPLGDFYLYGIDQGDQVLESTDDGSTEAIQLTVSFPFFDKEYNTIFVSSLCGNYAISDLLGLPVV